MGISTTWAVALPISLFGIPAAYFLNKTGIMEHPLFVLIAAAGCLVLVGVVPVTLMVIRGEKHDPFFYTLSLFTFGSVIDLGIGLENDGFVSNFMTFYLVEGEPYLASAQGTMICYWDGLVHQFIYVLMLMAESRSERWYRRLGLYWTGSIVNSMLVLLPGNLTGRFGIKWSFLMNIPYLIIPIWAGYRFLRSAPKPQSVTKRPCKPLYTRPHDVFFILYLLAAMALACFRGVTVLGCKSEICVLYLNQYEPILKDDIDYPKIQMLLNLFYFVPYYVAAVCGLWNGQPSSWMLDWSLIHAGAAAQGQFVHIGGATHHRTPEIYRLPPEAAVRLAFFLINGALFVIPQLLAARCVLGRTFSSDIHPVETRSSHNQKGLKQN